MLPTEVLKQRADEYVEAGLIDKAMGDRVLACIIQERGTTTYFLTPMVFFSKREFYLYGLHTFALQRVRLENDPSKKNYNSAI